MAAPDIVTPCRASMSPIYLLLWGYLSGAVAVGWWYRPGAERLLAVPLTAAALMLLLAALIRHAHLAAAGLVTFSAAMVSRSVSLIFAEDLQWPAKWLGINVWMVLAVWAMMRMRTVARFGVEEWGRDP